MAKRLLTIALLLALVAGALAYALWRGRAPEPIRVGVLHSLSGVMAFSESQLADSTLLAIEEINRQGGVAGRPLVPVVADGASDWPTFARQAEHLIKDEHVRAIFGCYTSASRKSVKPVVEKYHSLLFYPVPYEGVEESRNIVYNGASPNQLYVPAVKWCLDNLGRRFFLVGSDYIWPRTVNVLMRDVIGALRGQVLGEEYLPLGDMELKDLVSRIVEAKPDVVISTIVGPSNVAFFQALRQAGISAAQMPVMALAVSEVELSQMDPAQLAGNYSCWSYFESVDSPANRRFVQAFKAKYGQERVVNDSMEAGYFGVHLYAQAVAEAGTTQVDEVRRALADQSYEAPGGMVFLDGETLHTWKNVRIGRIRPDGQFDIVWASDKPVRPRPYPAYRSKSDWNALVNDLYQAWGGQWSSPAK